MKTTTFALVNHMTHGMMVHKVGCADIAREQKRRRLNGVTPVEVPDGEDIATAVARELCDDFGDPTAWKPSDIRVLPCCGGAR